MQYSSHLAAIKFAKLINDLPDLSFDSKNSHFKNEYLSLNGLLDAIKPVLKAHNAVLTTGLYVRETEAELFNVMRIVFTFIEGEEVHTAESHVIIPNLENPQQFGSYVTYVKRYAILSSLGVAADKDDDANESASAKTVTTTSTRRGLQRHGR